MCYSITETNVNLYIEGSAGNYTWRPSAPEHFKGKGHMILTTLPSSLINTLAHSKTPH